jgi:hypothetical protein
MHGTFVEQTRITSHARIPVYNEEIVRFGNEVTRGPGMCLVNDEPAPICCYQPIRWLPTGSALGERDMCPNMPFLLESFPPLHVVVRYSWVDDKYAIPCHLRNLCADIVDLSFERPPAAPKMSRAQLPPNTFAVPEYDDDDDEDDIAFVQETVLKPKLEVVLPRTHNSQDSELSQIKYTASEMPRSDMADYNGSDAPLPSPSVVSSPIVEASDTMSTHPTSAECPLITNSGSSGLTEAERQVDKRALDRIEQLSPSTGVSLSPDLTSPADGPTSSQTNLSDNHGVSILKYVADQVAAPNKSTTFIDQDLTQSECESDEAYSPDLIVDDSEDAQRGDIQTDYGSDSDEEALLMAEDTSTTKGARELEDSTDSESSESELSDDIGMEREEDFFDHPRSRNSEGKRPIPNAAYHDHDGVPTGQDQIPYNMRPGNFAMPCTRLNPPSNPMNRAPSPSDAAMAKPSDFPSPPSNAFPYNSSQPWMNSVPSAYGPTWPCSYDGRSHGPYDDRTGFPYSYGGTWPPAQFDPYRPFASPISVLPDQSFNSDRTATSPPLQSYSTDKSQSRDQMQGRNIEKEVFETVPRPQTIIEPAAKVSIDSTVERTVEEPTPTQPSKLKRKADAMISDDVAGAAEESLEGGSISENVRFSADSSKVKTVAMAQLKALQNTPSIVEQGQEPPAKRARTVKEGGGTSLATLAATALAGAVVGGVGVVAALVALPQDFFV